jgi:hypothetical protein
VPLELLVLLGLERRLLERELGLLEVSVSLSRQ